MRTATVRASKSELLPAPNGTTMRIGRTGKSAAPAATAVVISIARSRHRFIVINSVIGQNVMQPRRCKHVDCVDRLN
jgi:hypothetical protein